MSRLAHRQPVWNWGTLGVVLLSTLLLSPVAGNALWHALFTAEAQASAAAASSASPQKPSQSAPPSAGSLRRVSPDEEALLAAAKSGMLRAIRLDTDPEHPGAGAIAFVVPTRTLLLVSHESAQASPLPPRLEGVCVSPASSPASPRAPPLA